MVDGLQETLLTGLHVVGVEEIHDVPPGRSFRSVRGCKAVRIRDANVFGGFAHSVDPSSVATETRRKVMATAVWASNAMYAIPSGRSGSFQA